MSKRGFSAVLPLPAVVFLSACDGRSAESCASKTELTVLIRGRTYSVPAGDQPSAVPLRKDDIFAVSPSERSTGDLLYCQRKERVPVKLKALTLRPSSLKPPVVQFSIDDVQREAVALPTMEDVLSNDWLVVGDLTIPTRQRFRLRQHGPVFSVTCTPNTWLDASGRPIHPRCDLRVSLAPQGALRLQYLQPEHPEEARQILTRVDRYLNSLAVAQ